MEQFASTYIPLTSAIISVIFAVFVLNRYNQRGGKHLLFWGLGMIFYAIGGFTEAYYGAFGYHTVAYKLWYLCGAILVAAWLGQGTVFLLWKNKTWAKVSLYILIIGSIISTILIIFAATTPEALLAGELTGKALPSYMRIQTPFYNIYGTVFLVGGAIYSAWLFFKKRVFLHRVLGNILIAAGALAPAIGGTLNRAGTVPYALYVGELVGAILMFAGFLRATAPMGEEVPQTAEAAA